MRLVRHQYILLTKLSGFVSNSFHIFSSELWPQRLSDQILHSLDSQQYTVLAEKRLFIFILFFSPIARVYSFRTPAVFAVESCTVRVIHIIGTVYVRHRRVTGAEICTWSHRYIDVRMCTCIIHTQRRPVTLSGYRNGIPLALYTDIRIILYTYMCTTRKSQAPNRDADTRGPPNIPIHGLRSNYIVVTVYCRGRLRSLSPIPGRPQRVPRPAPDEQDLQQ